MTIIPYTDVVLVDSEDNEIGRMEKLEAHEKGILHRAFSVLVFNNRNELLLQQRAFGKYHSEGLWTNTCCSHPLPGETNISAAKRRLQEEMGFVCDLEEIFNFLYRAELDNGLIENEIDYVIIVKSDKTPLLNLKETIAYKWMNLEDIQQDILVNPTYYTHWFKIIILNHFDKLTTYLTHESLQKRNI